MINNIDTWPDWKMDTSTLAERNKRRKAGEILPKPTIAKLRIAELEQAVREMERLDREAEQFCKEIVLKLAKAQEERDSAREAVREMVGALNVYADIDAFLEGNDWVWLGNEDPRAYARKVLSNPVVQEALK